MRWNHCQRLLSESKDKYKQHNVTAVSHHQAATWVFSLKKEKKKNLPLIDGTGAEIKTASLRWCQHSGTDSEVALTASVMVVVAQLHPVTAYGSQPKSALVTGPQMSQSGGRSSGRLPPIYKNAHCCQAAPSSSSPPFSGSKMTQMVSRKALRGWHLALCSTLKLCLTVPSWPPLASWATLPLISQHFP